MTTDSATPLSMTLHSHAKRNGDGPLLDPQLQQPQLNLTEVRFTLDLSYFSTRFTLAFT